jgi:hypothetical protein
MARPEDGHLWSLAHAERAAHNQRRLAEHRGSTPAETLERFRAVITSTTAPSSHTPACRPCGHVSPSQRVTRALPAG